MTTTPSEARTARSGAGEPAREVTCEPGVVDDERRVGADRRAIGQDRDAGEQPRRQRRAGDRRRAWPRRWPARLPPARRRPGGHRPPGPATQMRIPPPRPRPRWVATRSAAAVEVRDRSGRGDARRAGVEPGQVGLADGDDRHAARLEVLERCRHVQDGLGAGADDGHRASGRAPRGRTRCRRWARDAAPDAARRRGRRGGRHRSRRSRRPRSRQRGPRSSWPRPSWPPSRRRRAPPRGSAGPPCAPTRGSRGQRRERRIVEADEQAAVVDRDRRRDRAGRPDRGLRRRRDLDVLRIRQAVADQRGFQGDDRPALGEGGRDLGGDVRRSISVVWFRIGRTYSRPVTPSGNSGAWRRQLARRRADDPPTAARWSDAGSDRPRPAPRTSRPGTRRRRRRRPRSCRPPRHAPWRPRSGSGPSPTRARTVAPFGPRLTTAAARTPATHPRAGRRGAPRPRLAVANSRSGATSRDQRPRRAPAVGQQRPDRGEVDADERTRRACQLDRRAARRPRAARRAASRPAGGAHRRRANQAARRSSGRSWSAAPRSATKLRSPPGRDEDPDPAGPRAGTRATRGVTPSLRSVSTRARPGRIAPDRRDQVDRAPSRPSQRAVFAADPPCTSETRPGTSVPDSSGRAGASTTSSIRSPRTTIRAGPLAADPARAPGRAVAGSARAAGAVAGGRVGRWAASRRIAGPRLQ